MKITKEGLRSAAGWVLFAVGVLVLLAGVVVVLAWVPPHAGS